METRVLLLRHAETATPDRFHGAESDVGLGARGLRQAALVAQHLAGRLISPQILGGAAEIADQQHLFHWPLEFPEVFGEGGFDVILSNPPYGAEISKEEK